MAHLGPVPHHPGYSGFTNNLSAALLYPPAFFQRFGLVISGQRFARPHIRIVRILSTEDDGGIADVADVNFAAANESYARRRTGGARKTRRRFRPIFCENE